MIFGGLIDWYIYDRKINFFQFFGIFLIVIGIFLINIQLFVFVNWNSLKKIEDTAQDIQENMRIDLVIQ